MISIYKSRIKDYKHKRLLNFIKAKIKKGNKIMFRKKLNQNGFSAVIVVILVLVIGVVGLGVSRVINNGNTKQSVNRQAETSQAAPLTALDTAVLADAKELKKIDFDLDGVRNAQDTDDDNDGINDDADADDDNDGINDAADVDDDNDGTEDSEDSEAAEATEAAELEEPDQD